MTGLLEWAERQIKVVEQNGACAATIRLVTPHDNEVWETWHAPFGDPAAWVTGAETFLRSLETEWPNRAVSVVFIAASATGEVLSRMPCKVQGKNKGAGAPWNTDQAAFSMAMDNVAVTIEKLLRLTNGQLDSARRLLESSTETVHQQAEYIRILRHNALLSESDNQPDALTKLIGEHGSDFMEIAKMFASSSLKKAQKTNGAITVPATKPKE